MKKAIVSLFVGAALAACNAAGDGSASGDSLAPATPSTVYPALDSAAVAPMIDTTTAGTGKANSGQSGLGTTGSGVSQPADSMQR